MAQLRFEVHPALPVLKPGADGEAVITEVAKLAVSGRAGTEVVQVTAPDITDVTSLGVRASDGGSIYRPPNEERYSTLPHRDTEQQILAAAKRPVPQLVSGPTARAAVEQTGLNAEQRDAVVTMLTAPAATTVLVAPAGAGKSHTMAGFARLWTTFTGRRVIGLTTSTNAARVLAHEGLAESYNIAEFLGKTEGSDQLRRPVPLHQDDVLVLDEASQLATADLAPPAAAPAPARCRSRPASPPPIAGSSRAPARPAPPGRSRPGRTPPPPATPTMAASGRCSRLPARSARAPALPCGSPPAAAHPRRSAPKVKSSPR